MATKISTAESSGRRFGASKTFQFEKCHGHTVRRGWSTFLVEGPFQMPKNADPEGNVGRKENSNFVGFQRLQFLCFPFAGSCLKVATITVFTPAFGTVVFQSATVIFLGWHIPVRPAVTRFCCNTAQISSCCCGVAERLLKHPME